MPHTGSLGWGCGCGRGRGREKRLRRATHSATGDSLHHTNRKRAAATSRHVWLASRSPERIMVVHDNFVFSGPKGSTAQGKPNTHMMGRSSAEGIWMPPTHHIVSESRPLTNTPKMEGKDMSRFDGLQGLAAPPERRGRAPTIDNWAFDKYPGPN
jgi:hypothetical protein